MLLRVDKRLKLHVNSTKNKSIGGVNFSYCSNVVLKVRQILFKLITIVKFNIN